MTPWRRLLTASNRGPVLSYRCLPSQGVESSEVPLSKPHSSCLFRRRPDLVADQRYGAGQFVREHLLDAPARGVPALSDEEARTLEALGYVE